MSHEGEVRAIAFLDETTLVSGGADGRVIRWDLLSGAGQVLRREEDPIIAVAADASRIAVAAGRELAGGRVLQLDPKGRELAAWKGDEELTRLLFSGAGDLLVGGEEALRLWRAGGRAPQVLEEHEGEPVRGLARSGERVVVLTADGARLLTPGRGGALAAGGLPEAQPRPRGSGVSRRALAASLDGGRAAASIAIGMVGKEVQLHVWELAERGAWRLSLGPGAAPEALAFASDGEHLFGIPEQPLLRVWSLAARREALAVPLPASARSLAVAHGRVVVGLRDSTLLVWDEAALLAGRVEPARRLGSDRLRHGDVVSSLAYFADGRLVSGSWDGSAAVWGEDGQALARLLDADPDGGVEAVAASPDGRHLAVRGRARARVHDLEARAWVAETRVDEGCGGLAFAGRGDVLVIGGAARVLVWRWRQGKVARRALKRKERVSAVAAAGDLVAVGQAGAAAVLDLDGPGEVALAVGGAPAGVAITADGATVWTGGPRVATWDARTGRRGAAQLAEAPGRSHAVGVTADGARVAASCERSGAHLVDVWDVATGKRLARLAGHSDQVSAVAFHPAGDRVATGSWDATIRLWPLAGPAAAPRRRAAAPPPEVSFDAESVESEEAYTDLLQRFADASAGAFRPQEIEEEHGDDHVRLAFRLGGRDYERSLERTRDWVDPTFVDLINEALADQGEARRFVLRDADAWTCYVFTAPPGAGTSRPAASGRGQAAPPRRGTKKKAEKRGKKKGAGAGKAAKRASASRTRSGR
ncbi:MAG: hypothetical protein KF878_07595 [Planctomycetes bacterium]|nr:hypothetical protein [Planctomycetota bacterium]